MAHVCAGWGGWGGADGPQAPTEGERGGWEGRMVERQKGRKRERGKGRKGEREKGRKGERRERRKCQQIGGCASVHLSDTTRMGEGWCWMEGGVVGKGRSNIYTCARYV